MVISEVRPECDRLWRSRGLIHDAYQLVKKPARSALPMGLLPIPRTTQHLPLDSGSDRRVRQHARSRRYPTLCWKSLVDNVDYGGLIGRKVS